MILCILTCVCTLAHMYITTPQEKSGVKPWCVQSHSQVFLASTSFPGLPCLYLIPLSSLHALYRLIPKPSLSLPHSQAISLQYKSGETKLSKAWDNILSPPSFSFSKTSRLVIFCTLYGLEVGKIWKLH